MSRKNVILPHQIIVDGDMSGNLTSEAVNIQYLDNAGIQVKFSGTPEGIFEVEASINGVDFEALDFGTTLVAEGTAGSFLINMQQLPYVQIRLKYTATTSTGVLNAWIAVKEL